MDSDSVTPGKRDSECEWYLDSAVAYWHDPRPPPLERIGRRGGGKMLLSRPRYDYQN